MAIILPSLSITLGLLHFLSSCQDVDSSFITNLLQPIRDLWPNCSAFFRKYLPFRLAVDWVGSKVPQFLANPNAPLPTPCSFLCSVLLLKIIKLLYLRHGGSPVCVRRKVLPSRLCLYLGGNFNARIGIAVIRAGLSVSGLSQAMETRYLVLFN